MQQLLNELQAAPCYPNATEPAQIIQTHLSIVCLTGDRVYKLKKSITLPFVDFAPLAARRQACRDEVRLNRRLCPDTYLGTAALRRVGKQLKFAAIGDDEGQDDLDVAVVMQRLPQERMLDELVAAGTASTQEMRQLAQIVANFHATAATGPEVLSYGAPEKLVAFADDNFTELMQVPAHGLPTRLLAQLQIASSNAFAQLLPELQERALHGRVVDGHGDLHARNICMTEPPTIYDCIEFEPAFRCGDVATEIAFLAMDLRYRNARELTRAFVTAYVEISGDTRLPALLPTLCSYRAMVRGKVAAMTAAEPELAELDREAAHQSARKHLLLASAYTIESCDRWWLLVCGPPASGKSQLCRALRDAVAWPHFATDAVRKQLAGIAATEHASPEHYSKAFSERTYQRLLQLATDETNSGSRCVLLDGNFPTPAHRAQAAQAAHDAGVRLAIVYLHIDAETAAQRASERQRDMHNISDADAKIANTLHAQFLAPTAEEAALLLALPGTCATPQLMEQVLTSLLSPTD